MALSELVDVREVPATDSNEAVGQIRHERLARRSEDAAEDKAAVHAGHGDHVVVPPKPELRTQRLPADVGQRLLIFGQYHSGAVTERGLVVFVGGESTDVAQVQPEPSGDAGIGVGALPKDTLPGVEAEFGHRRPIHDDEGVGPGGVARVLDAVTGIGDDFGECQEHGQVPGLTTGHDGIDGNRPDRDIAARGPGSADYSPGVIVQCGEKRRDPVLGRWNDRQSIAPTLNGETLVDIVNRSCGDDIQWCGLGGGALADDRCDGEAGYDLVECRVTQGTDHLVVALRVHVPAQHAEGKTVESRATTSSRRLAFEAFADQRHRRHPGGFRDNRRPHHGGRTTPSTSHPGDDGVDTAVAQPVGKRGNYLGLITPVRVAEFVVPDDFDPAEAVL